MVAEGLAARGKSDARPLADARGSAESMRYRAATVRERVYPRAVRAMLAEKGGPICRPEANPAVSESCIAAPPDYLRGEFHVGYTATGQMVVGNSRSRRGPAGANDSGGQARAARGESAFRLYAGRGSSVAAPR